MKKIILFLVLLLLGAGIYLYITKNNISKVGDTDNWQTFSDQKYGFEIKIPKNWTGEQTVNEKGVTVYKFSDGEDTMIGINVPVASDFRPKTAAVSTEKSLNGYAATYYDVGNGVEIYIIKHSKENLALTMFYTPDTQAIVGDIVKTLKYK